MAKKNQYFLVLNFYLFIFCKVWGPKQNWRQTLLVSEPRDGPGLILTGIQHRSPVSAARVAAYAFLRRTAGAASARQDVPPCFGNPSGLSLLLPGAAADKQP